MRFIRFSHLNKRVLFGALGATLLAGSLSACGHMGDGPRWGAGPMSETDAAQFRGKMVDRIASKLDLDAPQKQLLSALGEKLHAQRKALMGNSTDPRADLQALVAGNKFDRSRAQTLVNDKTDIVRHQSPEVIAAFGDFYDSLRPEQQQKVRDFMQKRRGHHWGG